MGTGSRRNILWAGAAFGWTAVACGGAVAAGFYFKSCGDYMPFVLLYAGLVGVSVLAAGCGVGWVVTNCLASPGPND